MPSFNSDLRQLYTSLRLNVKPQQDAPKEHGGSCWEHASSTQQISEDLILRLIGSAKFWNRGAALTSRLQKFEAERLTKTLLTRRLFGATMRRIAALPLPTG